MKSYREILGHGEVALAVKTNGLNLKFNPGGVSETGFWAIAKDSRIDKVIVFVDDKNGAKVIIGDYVRREARGKKYAIVFDNSRILGRTDRSWTQFTEGKNRGYQRIYLSIDDEGYTAYPEEEVYKEGSTRTVLVNTYEREPKARAACIKHYGLSCQVCNMKFSEKYGKIGENFIHVHHIIPLSKIKKGYIVDPIKDLRPVCPNCHAMLHASKMHPDELRAIIGR